MISTSVNSTSWTRSHIVLLVATLILAGAIALVSLGFARAKPVASEVLSAPWQCTQTAGILTVCTKNHG